MGIPIDGPQSKYLTGCVRPKCVLFITTITLAMTNDDGSIIESDHDCDVLVCVKYAIWLVLSRV